VKDDVKPVLIEDIKIDSEAKETQLRERLCDDTVARYVEALERGDTFPAVELVPVGDGSFYIADGWHRVIAHRTAGRRTVDAIEAFVPPGADPLMVAKRLALRANRKHGLPLSPGDQMKRAKAAILMPCFRGWSLRQLEREVGVSRATLGRARTALLEKGEIPWIENEKLPSWWPAVYASTHKLGDPWEGDEDLREATARLVRELDAPVNSRDWEFVYFDQDDRGAAFREHVVIHRGIVADKELVIPVLDNPVTDGKPARSWLQRDEQHGGGGSGSGGDGSRWRDLTQEERDKIAEHQRRKKFYALIGKLLEHPIPFARKIAREAPRLREVPGLWSLVRELAEAGGPPGDHEPEPFADEQDF
jgi:hypothetical protein